MLQCGIDGLQPSLEPALEHTLYPTLHTACRNQLRVGIQCLLASLREQSTRLGRGYEAPHGLVRPAFGNGAQCDRETLLDAVGFFEQGHRPFLAGRIRTVGLGQRLDEVGTGQRRERIHSGEDRRRDSTASVEHRDRLLYLLKNYFRHAHLETDWKTVVDIPPERLVNTLTTLLPLDGLEKQAILEAVSAQERVDTLITALEMQAHEAHGTPRH